MEKEYFKNKNYLFIIVGVGGTGSLLARDLPKLILEKNHAMCLLDGDIVEKKNIKRQSYQSQDIGENKAIALESKISTFYDIPCYSIPKYLMNEEITRFTEKFPNHIPVILGCVDNNKTRIILENTFNTLSECIYIDSANGEYEGNLYIKMKLNGKEEGVLRSEVYDYSLDFHPLEESCEAQADKGNVQYLVTNNKMSNAILEHLFTLLQGELKGGIQDVKRFNSKFY